MEELHIYKNLYDITTWSKEPEKPGLTNWQCVRRWTPEEWEMHRVSLEKFEGHNYIGQ